MMESEQHQLLRNNADHRTENNKYRPAPRHDKPSKQQVSESIRGAVRTLCVALGLFLFSAGCGRYFLYSSTTTSASSSSSSAGSDGSNNSSSSLQNQAQSKEQHTTWTNNDERPANNPIKYVGSTEGFFDTKLCTQDLSLPVLEGADVVSYFSLDDGETAIYGMPEYESVFRGNTFFFVSEEHKAAFEADPVRYIPGWGGFCAWGISNEGVWNKENLGPFSDPNSWVIGSDGVLYFFRSEVAKELFIADLAGNIEKGNGIWRSWWGDAAPGGRGLDGPMNVACFCDLVSCPDD